MLGQRPDDRPGEGEVPGSLAVRPAPEPVDPAHELGVEPDPGVEGEPATVDAAEGNASRAAVGNARSGAFRVAWEPEARGSTLVPPPGTNPSGTSPTMPLITSLYVPSPENT